MYTSTTPKKSDFADLNVKFSQFWSTQSKKLTIEEFRFENLNVASHIKVVVYIMYINLPVN